MKGGAWCSVRHDRAGLVSNQNLSDYDPSKPLASVTTCDRPECIEKATRYVAAETNQTATYYSDAEQRVTKAVAR